MRRLALWLLVALLCPVFAGGQNVITVRRAAAAGGSCTEETTDDFSTASLGNYTETCAGPCNGPEWAISGEVLTNSGSSGEDMQLTHDTSLTDSDREWACQDLVTSIDADETAMVLRVGADTLSPYYMAGYLHGSSGAISRLLWRSCESETAGEPKCNANTIQYCDETDDDCVDPAFGCPAVGDTLCWEIDGEGTSTTLRFWKNPTGGTTPDDWGTEDAKFFGDGATAPTCPSGWTASPAGDGAGICANSVTTKCTVDGDCTPSTCEFADTGLRWGTYGEDNGVGDQDNFAAGSCPS